ncbi:hypothetical protein [Geothrix sp. 21YS21S-2]|uniref:hypothetical protein n=1 Tax=Geothrix sp. 21YS21S-2 TaxID=3068893 RepID=UPI0027B8ED61|nr:hypothetical protein [Geothrix sp. 21YS21S-2]
MPSLRPLHLLLLGAAFAVTGTLPAAEDLIRVTNHSTAKYYLLLNDNDGSTGKITVFIDGKSTELKAWDEMALPPQKVANIFVGRAADGKLKQAFRIRDEGYKQIEVKATAGRTGEAMKVALPAGAKIILSAGDNLVIGQPRL